VATIEIAAAVILDDENRLLLVRKQGSGVFIQPGGKIEPGETPEAALRRELAEEIAVTLQAEAVEPLGLFEAPAAHEPGALLRAHLFAVRLDREPTARAEIAEIVWADPEDPGAVPMAPLTADHVLPLARRLRCPPAAALL